jgi:hypothetical protein
MLSRLGASTGRRTNKPQLLPTLGQMPFTDTQKQILDMRARQVAAAPPWLHPALTADAHEWANAAPFSVSTAASGNLAQPFVPYPQPGQGRVTVISYTVRPSKIAFIRFLAVCHFGGNDPSGSGQVIWRVLRNGGGLRGLNNLIATFGTYAGPKALPVPIIGIENDTIIVTVEVPLKFPDGTPVPPLGAGQGTAATFDGFTYPLSEAISPRPGSY